MRIKLFALSMTAIVLTAAAHAAMEPGTARIGTDLMRFYSPSAEACAKTCTGMISCQSWTYQPSPLSGSIGVCVLKSDTPPAIKAPCCTSGLHERPVPEPIASPATPEALPTEDAPALMDAPADVAMPEAPMAEEAMPEAPMAETPMEAPMAEPAPLPPMPESIAPEVAPEPAPMPETPAAPETPMAAETPMVDALMPETPAAPEAPVAEAPMADAPMPETPAAPEAPMADAVPAPAEPAPLPPAPEAIPAEEPMLLNTPTTPEAAWTGGQVDATAEAPMPEAPMAEAPMAEAPMPEAPAA